MSGERRTRFVLLDCTTLATLPSPAWQVADVLPLGGLGVLYGPPGACKSFLALAWACHVATGRPWLGHRVLQGPVVYVSAEGAAGLPRRLQAWSMTQHFPALDALRFLASPVNLLMADDVRDLATVLATLDPEPTLLVIDTLSRCMVGGDENATKDMGLAVAAMDSIRERFHCTVLALHHPGKAENAVERGSTALRGAADAMWSVKRDGDAVTLACGKMKDAPETDPMTLRQTVVDLGDGQTSCVIEAGEPSAEHPSGSVRQALETLHRLGPMPHGRWQKATDLSEGTFARAFGALRAAHLIDGGERRGAPYTLTAAGLEALKNGSKPRGSDEAPHAWQ